MKVFVLIACYCFATVNLHADKKWIAITPIAFDEPSKKDTNLSKTPPSMIDNIKRLQRLLDKQQSVEALKNEKQKNWYLFDDLNDN